MRNQGIEFSTNLNLMQRQNFNWNFYFNFTHYTNKITMLPEERKTREVEGYKGYANGTSFIGEGLPLHTFYMYKYAGVDSETGNPLWWKDVTDENGNVTREKTASYASATQYLCGDPTPDLYGGFGTSVDFFGFDASVAFTYSIGGLSYDSGYAGFMASPTGTSVGGNYHRDLLNAWSEDNKSSNIPRLQYGDEYSVATSDRFLVDASYLNIQNITIGYTLPQNITRKFLVSKLRVYVVCDNVWYWSRRKGFDPRYSFSGGTNNVSYSPIRTISGGINVTF
jgi:hypothetical protein